MKIYYIANARMPTEKAHGIQIAEMCEAFIEAGVDVTLIVPRRTADPRSVREYYGLRTDVPVRRLPVLPFYNGERAGFSIASLSFMCSAAVFLLLRRVKSSSDVIYTVDMDTFSFTPLPLFGMPCFIEIHGQKPSTSVTRYFFRHARGVIVTNTEIERAISGTFNLPTQKLLVEPNGADLSAYKNLPSKEEARRQLGLPLHERTALYIGRFYEWKGLEILPAAARLQPDVAWYAVGGDAKEFAKISGVSDIPANMHCTGSRPAQEIPLWLAAADVLLILGTKNNIDSYRYTSPMKIFEYMASCRPVVASRTPALASIIPESDVVWYEPDDAHDLARVVNDALHAPNDVRLMHARNMAEAHSWGNRAARILAFIEANFSL